MSERYLTTNLVSALLEALDQTEDSHPRAVLRILETLSPEQLAGSERVAARSFLYWMIEKRRSFNHVDLGGQWREWLCDVFASEREAKESKLAISLAQEIQLQELAIELVRITATDKYDGHDYLPDVRKKAQEIIDLVHHIQAGGLYAVPPFERPPTNSDITSVDATTKVVEEKTRLSDRLTADEPHPDDALEPIVLSCLRCGVASDLLECCHSCHDEVCTTCRKEIQEGESVFTICGTCELDKEASGDEESEKGDRLT